ncbi:MAG: (deoxy)nucleoside triphosphate pyrophosphohydrolase [Saprospiraceae bacterium]
MLQVVCALIERDGKVLLAQRSASMRHPGLWEFPGGKLEGSESPEQCLLREIKEELGIAIAIIQPLPALNFQYPGEQPFVLIPFIAYILSGEISLTEHSAVVWVLPDQLLDWPLVAADVGVAKCLMSR